MTPAKETNGTEVCDPRPAYVRNRSIYWFNGVWPHWRSPRLGVRATSCQELVLQPRERNQEERREHVPE